MNFLYELNSIPEPIKVEYYINNVVKQYIFAIKSWILENGFRKESDIIGKSHTFEFHIPSKDNNTYWIGDDIGFRFNTTFYDGNPDARLFPEIEGEYAVNDDDKVEKFIDSNGVFHGMELDLDIPLYFVDYKSANDPNYVNVSMNWLKNKIRHEIDHSFTTFTENLNCEDGFILSVAKYNSLDNFIQEVYEDGPNVVCDILYLTSKHEVSAHISEFYQECKNDIDISNKLKDINEYRVYTKYKRSLSIFPKVIEPFYNKYRDRLINIYGKDADKLYKFKDVILDILKKTIYKMDKVYFGVKDGLYSPENKYNYTMDKHIKERRNGRNYYDVKEGEEVLWRVCMTKYTNDPYNHILGRVDDMFKNFIYS